LSFESNLSLSVEKFEIYCKTKIEPAFNSEAKVHALESKFEEQEQFFSYVNLFTKDIMKKLIYAIQKHNLGTHKWLEENKVQQKRLSDGSRSPQIYVTEAAQETTQNDAISNDDTPSMKYSTMQNWRRKTQTSFGSRKASGKFNLMSMKVDDENSFGRDSPEALPSLIKPGKRKGSAEIDEQNNNNNSIEKTEQPQQPVFDKMLHKRLEALREALVNEKAISQKFNKAAEKEALTHHQQVKTVPDSIPKVQLYCEFCLLTYLFRIAFYHTIKILT